MYTIMNTCFIVIGGACERNDSDNAKLLFVLNFSPLCWLQQAQVAFKEMQLKRWINGRIKK